MARRFLTSAVVIVAGVFTVGCAATDELATGSVISPAAEGAYDGDDGVERIRYRSTDVLGQPSEVTALVAVPDAPPPVRGWDVVALAHGTTGVADECAPSADPGLAGVGERLAALADAGYVAVATDYEGLGTAGPHPWLNGRSAARAVVDSVRAAQAVAPPTSGRWAVVGHSQGGHAAAFTAALAEDLAPELELVGAVAIAPAGDVGELAGPLGSSTSPFLVLFASSFLAARPDVEPHELLSEEGIAAVERARETCLAPGTSAPVLRRHLRSFGRYVAANRIGDVPTEAPVLVQLGSADRIVTPAHALRTIDRLCRDGADLAVEVLDGADHSTVLHAGEASRMAWLRDRFAGGPFAGDCPSDAG